MVPKIKRQKAKKRPALEKGTDAVKNGWFSYWFVLVVPPAAELVEAGGEDISSCWLQPISMVETAAIKNNNFFIRNP